MRRLHLPLLALSIALLTGSARAEDWPRWLGPRGDGISGERNLLDRWPESGPRKLWSVHVGLGFASPIAVKEKVYVIGMLGDKDALSQIDATTGQLGWTSSYVVSHEANQRQAMDPENGLPIPDATPTIEGTDIVTLGGGGDLVCRDLAAGKVQWKINVLDETRERILGYNCGSTPLVTDKIVCVQVGSGGPVAVGVGRQTGAITWRSEATGKSGYAAPILITVAGKPQIVVLAGKAVYGIHPDTGKTIWSFPWATGFDVNATTPVFRDGYLFITSAYGHGCAMLKIDESGAKQVWQGKEVSSKFQPLILDGDRLYANSNGRLKCLQWPTNQTLFKSNEVDLGEGGTMVLAGDKMITMSETGQLSLLTVSPNGVRVSSEMELFHTDKIWATPLIYDGKLYARGRNDLVCLQISGKGGATTRMSGGDN